MEGGWGGVGVAVGVRMGRVGLFNCLKSDLLSYVKQTHGRVSDHHASADCRAFNLRFSLCN